MVVSTLAADRPSQIVHERTVATTPNGRDVVVAMERLSTGGTLREARYERPVSGPMSGSQRMAKQRARTSLFPDKHVAEKEKNTGRMAAIRAAEIELAAENESREGTDDYTIDMSAAKFCSASSFWPKALMFRIVGADAAARNAAKRALVLRHQSRMRSWSAGCSLQGIRIKAS